MENEGKKYDLIAEAFSRLRSNMYAEKTYLDLLIEHLSRGAHILDIGCGTGFPIASYLIKHGFKLTGIDASFQLLKIANEQLPAMNCIYGDMRLVSLREKYDGLIAWISFSHLPREDQIFVISRFAYWLKPNGMLLFTTSNKKADKSSSKLFGQEFSYYSLSDDLYIKFLEANQFKVILSEPSQEGLTVWFARFKPAEGYHADILFRPLHQADMPLLYKWFNQSHVQQFYSLRSWSEEEVSAKLKPYVSEDSPVQGYVILADDIPIGYIQIYKISDYPQHSYDLPEEIVERGIGLDLFIGDADYVGKGLGQKSIQQFLIKRIWPEYDYCVVDPNTQNAAAIHCYEKLGFTEHKIIESKDDLQHPTKLKLMILTNPKTPI